MYMYIYIYDYMYTYTQRIGAFRLADHLGTSQGLVSQDTMYSRIEVSRPTSHLGTSQAGTRYPGIQSIQELGCLGQPAIWGHPRLVLGIPGYKVFKD